MEHSVKVYAVDEEDLQLHCSCGWHKRIEDGRSLYDLNQLIFTHMGNLDQKCDKCSVIAEWFIFAAYHIAVDAEPHPKLARYPNPMIRVCSQHIAEAIQDDEGLLGSTHNWLVMRLTKELI